MPQIQAIYHNTDPNTGTVSRRVETGLNASERVSGHIVLPSDSIRRNAPVLADFMDKLQQEGQNVYSCAEVQALAKLLDAVPEPDFRKIIFIQPNEKGETEFWRPCQGCQSWLMGTGQQYRISDRLLDVLQPPQSNIPFFDLSNPKLFPPLTNSTN
jgi:hypothetical protein